MTPEYLQALRRVHDYEPQLTPHGLRQAVRYLCDQRIESALIRRFIAKVKLVNHASER